MTTPNYYLMAITDALAHHDHDLVHDLCMQAAELWGDVISSEIFRNAYAELSGDGP